MQAKTITIKDKEILTDLMRQIEYKVIVPLIHNQYCVYSDEKDVSCLYEMTDRYSHTFFYDNQPIKLEIYSSDRKNYCSISGTSERDEKGFIKMIKPMVRDLCIMISYIFNRTNGNLVNLQPRVEPDWENKIVDSKQIAIMEEVTENKQSSDLEFSIGTLSVVPLVDNVSISLTTQIKPEELDLSCLENESFSFVANELYTALGTENIRSKYFHLFAIIEYCEEKYKDKDSSTKLFSLDEIEKIHSFFADTIEDGENKYNRINATIARSTNIGRPAKLLNVLNAMNIHEIILNGKNMPLNTGMLKKLSDLRGKLFHGNDVDNRGLIEPVNVLFELAIRILNYIKDADDEGST